MYRVISGLIPAAVPSGSFLITLKKKTNKANINEKI